MNYKILLVTLLLLSTTGLVSATIKSPQTIGRVGGVVFFERSPPTPDLGQFEPDWNTTPTEQIIIIGESALYPISNNQVILDNRQFVRTLNIDSAGHRLVSDDNFSNLWIICPPAAKFKYTALCAHGLEPIPYKICYAFNSSFSFQIDSYLTPISGDFTPNCFGYVQVGLDLLIPPFGCPVSTDYTAHHPNLNYTHPLGARIWLVPSSYIDPINNASAGQSSFVFPPEVDKYKIQYENDHVYLPPMNQEEFHYNYFDFSSTNSYGIPRHDGKVSLHEGSYLLITFPEG